MKTIKFYTLGCKVNQYDTQSIREGFLRRGFQEINNGRKARFYLVNTCTVTAAADRKSREAIRHCLKENPRARVIVTGCMVEKESGSLADINGISLALSKGFFKEGISNFFGHTRAFLKIQDGCDNFCAYCKVPLARGSSRSRPLREIVQEAQKLVKNGFKEIVLSGICLGAYGRDLEPKIDTFAAHKSSPLVPSEGEGSGLGKEAPLSINLSLSLRIDLVAVIEALENIAGLKRIRLSSIEAGDVSKGLISKMRQSKKLCRHLHIPIQSGDNKILKEMNRHYRRADYLKLIKKIKKYIPQIAITTDCLIGFPGEEEDNFVNTLDLVKKILPLKVHIFPYSRRAGTLAGNNLKKEIKECLIKERFLRLEKIAKACAFIYKRQFLNKNMEVLIESRSKEDPCYWEGHTDNYLKVLVKSNLDLKNQLISVKLKKIEGEFYQGKRFP